MLQYRTLRAGGGRLLLSRRIADLSATHVGVNGATSNFSFTVANGETEFNTGSEALSNIAGPHVNNFDWGLPFFYGRNVYTAIQGASTPVGPGPYWAY